MTRKLLLIGGGVVAIAIIAVAIFLVWWFVIRDDSPPPVSIEGAVATLEDDGTATAEATATATAPDATAATATATAMADSATAPAGAALEGAWTLAEGKENFVGYRVEEELATIGYKEAVGRSPTIEGTITVAGGQLTAVTVTADLRDLKSDDSRRDGALRSQALESSEFPMATFELVEPAAIPEGLAAGETISLEVNGRLTLHGVARAVTMPIEAELREGVLVVVGTLPIVFADYGIAQPQSPILVSIEDNGIMELQLFFVREG